MSLSVFTLDQISIFSDLSHVGSAWPTLVFYHVCFSVLSVSPNNVCPVHEQELGASFLSTPLHCSLEARVVPAQEVRAMVARLI